MSRAGMTGGVLVIAEVGAWAVGAGSAGGAGCVVPGALPVGGLVDAAEAPPLAGLMGLDLGPACQQCGGMMQRTGSCYTCSSCGNNTGCG